MAEKRKLLYLGDTSFLGSETLDHLGETFEIVSNPGSVRILDSDSGVEGIVTDAETFNDLALNAHILNGLPNGIAVVDANSKILWANECLNQWLPEKSIVGQQLSSIFDCTDDGLSNHNTLVTAALESNGSTNTVISCTDNRHFQIWCVPLNATPEFENNGDPQHRKAIVSVREITNEVFQQQKLTAIHKAGTELADLTAEEVFQMEVEQRIELLKSNILYYSKDILEFDVVEIRLLGRETGELMPLLSLGIKDEAASRPLFAKETGYGVTGYVAASGKSYLCEDTIKDPLYIEGCVDAKSSLTVPLMLHDQVIGTFNVESPKPRAFTYKDLQFLEIFSRDVANALNTLELLVAQQANTAQASVEAIHREVALPVDEILNDAVNVMEKYIGHDRSVVDRLKRILQNARDIKQLIYKVGQEMAPAEAVPACVQTQHRPNLKGRRILVVDQDEDVRGAAHSLLEGYECIVETAHEGGEAIYMLRNVGSGHNYDVVIAEIKLPDMSGFDLMMKLKEIVDPVPLILMTGFGYDPGHTIVKARQAGLLPNAVLYKPFRLDQLLEVVEGVILAYDNLQEV